MGFVPLLGHNDWHPHYVWIIELSFWSILNFKNGKKKCLPKSWPCHFKALSQQVAIELQKKNPVKFYNFIWHFTWEDVKALWRWERRFYGAPTAGNRVSLSSTWRLTALSLNIRQRLKRAKSFYFAFTGFSLRWLRAQDVLYLWVYKF